LDDPGVARVIESIERSLPVGVRRRQLGARTLLVGILLCLEDGRPAHLTRVHEALVRLCQPDRWRLGVLVGFEHAAHLLTYRQVERTAGLVVEVLSKSHPDGEASPLLSQLVDALMEASVAERYKQASSALAVDWTDLETFSCAPPGKGRRCADPEASWGHRRGEGPGHKDELFFGYYLQLATMVEEEDGSGVPELTRRMELTSCHVDPPTSFVGVLERMAHSGVAMGDVLADSGYAHRLPENWALPLRRLGASLVMDLHPHDRGPQGTYEGAICLNGNLYCPATPKALFDLGPLARDAGPEQIAAHDQASTELSAYMLGRITKDDEDGYRRVMCPAVAGKLRCPLRPESTGLSYERPEVLEPPRQKPACCTKKTITVPLQVNAKTAQKHPYPSAAHRNSYRRRSAAERANSTVKDPATNDVSRGWCRLMGLAPLSLFVACVLVVRNLHVTDAFCARQADDARRLAAGRAPRTRRRRRRTLADLVTAAANAPP
jgi:hypothetical protein